MRDSGAAMEWRIRPAGRWPCWHIRCRNLFAVAMLMALPAMPTLAAGAEIDDPVVGTPAEQRSDQAALGYLLGEQLLQQSAATICLQSRDLPAEQRFEELSRWVLPGHGHGFRLQGAFRRSQSPLGQIEVADETSTDLNSFPESAWLLSPARELIEVASQLDRLDELKWQTERFKKPSDREQADAQTTLLSLIEIENGNVEVIAQRLEDRFDWERTLQNAGSASQRWPDLLVLWSVAAKAATSHLLTEELFGAYPLLHQYSPDTELDLVNDYLRLLKGRCHAAMLHAAEHESTDALAAAPNALYETFSRIDAFSHGVARPLARFHVGTASAYKISGHEFDYLTYRGPVTGDYEVNCEVATRPGAFTALMVQGTATQPISEGSHISVGAMAKGNRELLLDPKLEEIESFSHLRVVVCDGVATHFFNGRPVFEASVEHASAPWVALRSWRGTTSDIRNLHLVGSPRIADSIDLLDGSLSGWANYYDRDSNAGLGEWNTTVGEDQSINLVSSSASGVQGSYDEDLIRYVRPINWDAHLSYEFQYQPGTIGVHPALGRSVFLIAPTGIRLHRLTNGRYEQSQLRPDSAVEFESPEHGSLVRTALKSGWNTAEMQISGDDLTLSLNGRPVAQLRLTPEHSRTFGLFRYRDQTQAVVRNLRLSGDWPKTLPTIEQQPMASKVVAELNSEAAELPANFVHDFGDGIPAELFDIEGDSNAMTKLPDGVRMFRTNDAGVRSMHVCVMIEGDFDIVAGYKDLEISSGDPTWHCGVGLEITLDNPTRDQCTMHRRRDRMQGHHYVGFGRKETNAGGKTIWIGGENVVDESTSGKLRLVRRGTQVYGLHAVGNSPSFRIIKTVSVPPGPIGVESLQLVTEVGSGLETSVTWTSLEIRAEKLDFMTVADQPKTLAMLNDLRQQKPVEIIDFTKQTLSDAGLYVDSGDLGKVISDQRGATVIAYGGDSGKRFPLRKQMALGSNFDIQADFQILRLDPGFQDQASSEVVLQVRLNDAHAFDPEKDAMQIYEATIILRHKWDGTWVVRPRVVARARGGSTLYRAIHSIPVKKPDQFRIVQHERVLYFIYSEEESPETSIIATYPLERDLTVSGINLYVIASRDQRIAETTWKRLQIHGTPALTQGLFRIWPALPSKP